jgi:hypothetical protein
MSDCNCGGLPYARLLANAIKVDCQTRADIRRIKGEMAEAQAKVAAALRRMEGIGGA